MFVPPLVRVYVCYQVSYSQISAPASVTSTHAPDGVNLLLSNQSKASVTTGGESLTDSLNSFARLCALSLLFESSAHTAAQINHNYSTCSTEMPASVKKVLCLFAFLSLCLSVLFVFSSREQGGKRKKGMTKCTESKMS